VALAYSALPAAGVGAAGVRLPGVWSCNRFARETRACRMPCGHAARAHGVAPGRAGGPVAREKPHAAESACDQLEWLRGEPAAPANAPRCGSNRWVRWLKVRPG